MYDPFQIVKDSKKHYVTVPALHAVVLSVLVIINNVNYRMMFII